MSSLQASPGSLAVPPPRPAGPGFGGDLIYRLRRVPPTGLAGIAMTILIVGSALLAPLIAPFDPFKHNLSEALQSPSGVHLLGTDEFGRDLLSRLLYGGTMSLQIAGGAVLLGCILGVPIGLLGGYYKGWMDSLSMRAIDILLAFPGILLAIAIVSVLGPGLMNLVFAVGIYSVPVLARITRSVTLETCELEYVEAARALGASNLRIMVKHILPSALSSLIVVGSLRMATALLTASGLSFLGIGVPPSVPEWGAMLSQGRIYFRSNPHVAVYPGLAIMLTVISFNLVGEALRDLLDPKSGRRTHRGLTQV